MTKTKQNSVITYGVIILILGWFRVGYAQAAAQMDCIIEPFQIIEISSPVDGIIASIDADRNDSIKKDQLLLRLESSIEDAQVAQAKAQKIMSSDILAAEASLAFAKQQLKRLQELSSKKLASSHDKDDAETKLKLAQAQLQKARDEQKLAELEYQYRRAEWRQRRILSPINGVVVQRYKSVGESVEGEPIMKIAQIDPLRAEVIVPAAYYGTIKPGMMASIYPEYPKDKLITAKVSIVDRVIDAASGTFGVRLDIPNKDHAIPGGLKCKITFNTNPTQAAIETYKQQ